MVLQALGDAMYGNDSLEDPRQALTGIESVLKTTEGKPTNAASSKYQQFLNGARFALTQRVNALDDQFVKTNTEAIKTIDDPNKLMLIDQQFKSDVDDGTINKGVYLRIKETIDKQISSVGNQMSSAINAQIDQIKSRSEIDLMTNRINEYKTVIGDTAATNALARLKTQTIKIEPYVQVDERWANVPTTENIAFGPQHDDAIDRIVTLNNRMPPDQL